MALGGVLEQVLQVERLAAQRQAVLVDAGEHEQRVGEPRQPLAVAERAGERGAQLRGVVAGAAQRDLQARAQDGDRRAQLVACVADDPPLALERELHAIEQVVERRREPVELVAGAGRGQALVGDRTRRSPRPARASARRGAARRPATR